MTPDELRNLRRMLATLSPASKPYLFLWTPDDGTGEPGLVVERARIPPDARLRWMKQGGRRFLEGTVTKNDRGFLAFKAEKIDQRRLDALIAGFVDELPILEGATLG